MRVRFGDEVEAARRLHGEGATKPGDRFGWFEFTRYPARRPLRVMVCDGDVGVWEEVGWPLPRWEHVSVSLADRCPTWDEMCFVKNMFWDEEETVIQLHPPQSTYVNNHPYVLHLWKPVGVDIPLPPPLTVGIKEVGDLTALTRTARTS